MLFVTYWLKVCIHWLWLRENSCIRKPNIRLQRSKDSEMGGSCGTYRGKQNCIQGFWWGNPKRKRSQHLGVGERIWNCILKKQLGEGDGLNWLRIGKGGGLLVARKWSSWFHKMRGILLVDKEIFLVSQEGFCSLMLDVISSNCLIFCTYVRWHVIAVWVPVSSEL